MPDIEIKRGYEVLPDNNVRFGIRVINNSDSAISDVEVILDYSESLFELEAGKIQKLGTIPPTVTRTAKFVLKPLGCIHKEEMNALITYKDHQWKKHVKQMRPKEVHCVCPFLKEKSITRAEFLRLSNSGFLEERGVNFEGIDVDKLVDFLAHTCKNRLYGVDEFPIEGGKILYLAGDALGEKAYYLLTAVVKEYEGLAQVLLRASSDKSHGLNGFLNEILDNLRHLVTSTSAREIGIIRKEQVINIIDSVVQRTTFAGGEGAASVTIKDSVVQRTEIKADEERKRREEEARDRKRKEEARKERVRKAIEDEQRKKQEQLRQQEEESQIQKAHENEVPKALTEGSPFIKLFAVVVVLGVLLVGGYIAFAPGATETSGYQKPTSIPTTGITATVTMMTPAITLPPMPSTPVIASASDQNIYTNSIGIEFVKIPAGEFDMGSQSNEAGRYDWEGPVHHVKIGKAFYMGKFEVTQKQWRDVMRTNPSSFKGDNLPVENVSWNDVWEFIKKLNEKEGTNKYRLPSEAEWEYVARAGTTTRYSFGDDESKLGDYAWYYMDVGKTHEVGQKKPNPWGLYDMYGNVDEWVQDIFNNSYYDTPTDGSAWEGVGRARVERGGSWLSTDRNCRSAYRNGYYPIQRLNDLGFRLLKDL